MGSSPLCYFPVGLHAVHTNPKEQSFLTTCGVGLKGRNNKARVPHTVLCRLVLLPQSRATVGRTAEHSAVVGEQALTEHSDTPDEGPPRGRVPR